MHTFILHSKFNQIKGMQIKVNLEHMVLTVRCSNLVVKVLNYKSEDC